MAKRPFSDKRDVKLRPPNQDPRFFSDIIIPKLLVCMCVCMRAYITGSQWTPFDNLKSNTGSSVD